MTCIRVSCSIILLHFTCKRFDVNGPSFTKSEKIYCGSFPVLFITLMKWPLSLRIDGNENETNSIGTICNALTLGCPYCAADEGGDLVSFWLRGVVLSIPWN